MYIFVKETINTQKICNEPIIEVAESLVILRTQPKTLEQAPGAKKNLFSPLWGIT
jgi:hypothetical protein